MAAISISSSERSSTPSREERLLFAITSCDITRGLYERAEAALNPFRQTHIPLGRWSFSFVPSTTSSFRGECDHHLQQIRLKETLNDEEAIGIATFELINAANSFAIHKVYKDLLSGRLSIEDFAKKMEELEDNSCVAHHRIILAAQRKMGWSSSVDLFADCASGSFEERWTKYKKDDPHAHYYRKIAKELVHNRVKGIMREVGYNDEQIKAYSDTQLETLAYGRDDSELRTYFYRERAKQMMLYVGYSSTEISSYTEDQLVTFASGKANWELCLFFRIKRAAEQVKRAMARVGFSEIEISLYSDRELHAFSAKKTEEELSSFLSALKRQATIKTLMREVGFSLEEVNVYTGSELDAFSEGRDETSLRAYFSALKLARAASTP